MDIVDTSIDSKKIEFALGLIGGLIIISAVAYLNTGIAPDLISIIAFSIVFSVTWYALDKLPELIK